MKRLVMLLSVVCLMGASQTAFCDSNPIAVGTEKITKAPFSMLMGANEHLFTPVKDINHGALYVTNEARAAVVSVGLNVGKPVEY